MVVIELGISPKSSPNLSPQSSPRVQIQVLHLLLSAGASQDYEFESLVLAGKLLYTHKALVFMKELTKATARDARINIARRIHPRMTALQSLYSRMRALQRIYPRMRAPRRI